MKFYYLNFLMRWPKPQLSPEVKRNQSSAPGLKTDVFAVAGATALCVISVFAVSASGSWQTKGCFPGFASQVGSSASSL